MSAIEITTERCCLQPLTESDGSDILKLVQSGEARRYLGGPVDPAAFPDRFRTMLNDGTTHRWTVRLRDDREFVGLLSIGPHHDGLDQEVSYQLHPDFWGRGFAAEALRALLADAWNRYGLDSVIAETQTANTRSMRLLERLGFRQERVLVRFDAEQAVFRLDRS